jgi:hypothetical protein
VKAHIAEALNRLLATFTLGRTHDRIARKDGDIELAGHFLNAACDIDRIAQDRELHAPLAADIAQHDLAVMKADAEPQGLELRCLRRLFQRTTASVIARAQASALAASFGPVCGVPKVAMRDAAHVGGQSESREEIADMLAPSRTCDHAGCRISNRIEHLETPFGIDQRSPLNRCGGFVAHL